MRALLVVNPTARQGHLLGDEVREELRRRGVEIVEDPAATGVDAIVVAGGDGTLTREIPRAIALGVPIGVVPLGTFNDLARTLAIPLDISGACAVIATGRARTIDAARVNGIYFLTEASIGISSRLARLQKPQDKKRFGLVAIAASLLLAAQHARSFHAEVAYDGRHLRLRSVQLTVANSQRFGGFITVDDASIDDGWLDLYSIEVKSVVEFYSLVAAIAAGRRESSPGLRTFRSTAFDIRTRRPHHISADGEPAGTTPARFELLPRALGVFAP
ncbi:MAG: YegS/Rv2252/BmrU family lipid kinase [Candidatus Cybelea sp.]